MKKVVFRKQVRSGLGVKADNATIDAYFDGLDGDGAGVLDYNELKKAFMLLNSAASEAQAEAERQRARAETLRARAKLTHVAAEATRAFEEKHVTLGALRKRQDTVACQVGTQVVHKCGSVVTDKEILEILTKNFSTGKRTGVQRTDFRKGLLALRVSDPAPGGEINALFDSLVEQLDQGHGHGLEAARNRGPSPVPPSDEASPDQLGAASEQEGEGEGGGEQQQQQQVPSTSPPAPSSAVAEVARAPASTGVVDGGDSSQQPDRTLPPAFLKEYLTGSVRDATAMADEQAALEVEVASLRRAAAKHQHELRTLEEREQRAEEQRRQRVEKDASAKAEAAARVHAIRAEARRARLAKKRDERARFEARAVTRRQKAASKRLADMGLELEASPYAHNRTERTSISAAWARKPSRHSDDDELSDRDQLSDR